MTAAEPPDLAFHATLFVAAVLTRAAKKRIETIMATQCNEPFGFLPAPTPQNPHHRRGEVVVTNPGGHTTQPLKRPNMSLQERLLALGKKRRRRTLTRGRQAQDEQVTLGHHPTNFSIKLAEIGLTLGARRMLLSNHHLHRLGQPQLHPSPTHIPRHRHLRDHRAMLSTQTLPNPSSGMPLLTRHSLISNQPLIDHPHPRPDRRRRTWIRLAWRRHRRRQRLPHRAPMHPVPIRQRPNRQLLPATIPPDHLEQLHPSSHRLRPPPAGHSPTAEITHSGVGPELVKTRHHQPPPHPTVGPEPMKKTAPAGARSDDHTQAIITKQRRGQ